LLVRPQHTSVSDAAAAVPMPAGKAVTGPIKGVECSACVVAVDQIETNLEPTIEKELEAFAEKLCTDIPGNLTTECDALVAQYLVPAIKALFSKANSTVVCELAGLCPKTSFVQGDMECRVCKAGAAAAEAKIESNATVTTIMTWADHACTIAPAPLQHACDAVLDGTLTKLMQAFEADATPEAVCQDLGLCTKAGLSLNKSSADVARALNVGHDGRPAAPTMASALASAAISALLPSPPDAEDTDSL